MDLSLFPEGRMLKRWWLGWRWSFIIALALERHLELAIKSREGSGQPITFSAVLMTLCSLFLSAVVQPVYHTGMACTSTLSIVARWKDTRSSVCSLLHLKTLKKWRRCWAFFTRADVFVDQDRASDIWVPRNLKEDTLST